MKKKDTLFVFFADDSKTFVTVYPKHLKSAPKDLFEFFQKIVWFIGFGVTVCEIPTVEISKNC